MTSQSAGDKEREFYDEMWSAYGALDAASPAAFHRRRLVADLAAKASFGTPRVLDVGCGQGDLLRDLAARMPGARLSGADISEASIAETLRKNPNYDVFRLDLASPSFQADNQARLGTFDLVVCSEVLEHIEDDATAAKNLGTLLAPGGALIVTVPGGSMSRFDVAIGHKRHYPRATIAERLAGAGLAVERVLAWGFPFHNLYRTAVRMASRLSLPGEKTGRGTQRPRLTGSASSAYVAFGWIMKPLFYLNLDRGGEQIVAVARRASKVGA